MALVASGRANEVVLIAGQIASGKTRLGAELARDGGAQLIVVRSAIQAIMGGAGWDRRRLQVEGAALDRRTNGRWLLEYVETSWEASGRLVVDAARTRRQVEPILDRHVGARLVFLEASEVTRRRRYAQAQAEDAVKRALSFDDAMAHVTESDALALAAMAHFVIETDDLDSTEVADEAVAFLGWSR
ncbi:MAG TPA: hypothetical protein VFB78_05215 [Acidimicrobiales bacterium]|nr:hypothetical protein [Acidimicrobiales bacterium]